MGKSVPNILLPKYACLRIVFVYEQSSIISSLSNEMQKKYFTNKGWFLFFIFYFWGIISSIHTHLHQIKDPEAPV